MRLAIISDLHLGEPVGRFSGIRRAAGRHDTAHLEAAKRLVQAINRYPEPLHTIVLGDLSDRSTAREFQEAIEVLDELDDELDAVIGNHDVTSVWKMGMGYSSKGHNRAMDTIKKLTGRSAFPYACDFKMWRLICLDSSAHNEKGTLFARGRIGNEQISFLATELADTRPTIVALHHYLEDLPWVLGVDDSDEVLRMLARDHVTVINGHRHHAGEYVRTPKRPRILTSGKSVETFRFRILDPVSGGHEWVYA